MIRESEKNLWKEHLTIRATTNPISRERDEAADDRDEREAVDVLPRVGAGQVEPLDELGLDAELTAHHLTADLKKHKIRF